jgi:hypothetical protein
MLRFLRELPLVWFLIGSAIAGIGILLMRHSEAGPRVKLVRMLALGAGLLTLAIFIGLNLYSVHSYMLDLDEADILSIASLHGQPMYHSVHSPNLSYSMMYGPLTFLIYRVGLVVGGGRFWVMRAMLVIVNLGLCVVLYSIFRKVVRRDVALALMALPLCQFLVQIKYAFGLRPDIWIVLAIALAVRSVLMDAELPAAILAGLFGGIAVDIKATVGFAFLLLLLMLYRRSGMKVVVIAAGVATITALAPFALPDISLVNYWSWLALAGHEARSARMIGVASAYAVFLILPLVVLRLNDIRTWAGRRGRRSTLEISLLTGCLLVAIAVASKTGAGIWHFWQFTPVVAAYVAVAVGRVQTSHTERLAYATYIVAVGSMVVALTYVRRDVALLRAPGPAAQEQLRIGRQEIDAYMKLYRGRTIQEGYGESHSAVESLRYIPVLRGQPYTLDGSERLEAFFIPFPAGILEGMEHCNNNVWLIPHGEKPMVFWYVFPPALHDTFVREYRMDQQGKALDAWVCKGS